jgi:NADPH:quinone reductase
VRAVIAERLGGPDVLKLTERATPEPGPGQLLGAAVVYDGVGQATFDDGLAALRRRGYMVLYGAASGPVPPLDPQRLNTGGSLFLTRPTLANYVATREELLSRAGDLFRWIRQGRLEVRIGGRYPLDQAARAQEDLAARHTTGKLILLSR